MEIRVKKINDNVYNFVNEYWENTRAWGHKTTLLKNGVELESNTCRYYNRTWESYTYETCMSCVVEKLEYNEICRYVENYKREHGISRFGKGKRQKVIDEFYETDFGKEIKILKETIRNRDFD